MSPTTLDRPAPEATNTSQVPGRHDTLAEKYAQVRGDSVALSDPLQPEDMVIQTMDNVSPTKWHLAHTTWFFERFVLREYVESYQPYHPRYEFLFNSYYNTIGPMHCRSNRGAVSRPNASEVLDYRRSVDTAVHKWLDTCGDQLPGEARDRVILGLNHEQQHQELIVTDIKHVLSTNPLLPAYDADRQQVESDYQKAVNLDDFTWQHYDAGLIEIGLDAESAEFAYDNESPRHRVFLEPYRLADRPVSNAEYLAFVEDGGYARHDLWLAEGWAWLQDQQITHPLYWYRDGEANDGPWMQYTLMGPRPLAADEPAVHLSYFEADAFARWMSQKVEGARLPTEAEWEHAAAGLPVEGHFADRRSFHPQSMVAGENRQADSASPRFMFGGIWEWTASSYAPYPGYRTAPGALGEYNGKFMCNQYVLRGGSCATPAGHVRPTYRNFFATDSRWQFTGLRLATDA
jgi:ergothioneine biosynthesis protein EgtB